MGGKSEGKVDAAWWWGRVEEVGGVEEAVEEAS